MSRGHNPIKILEAGQQPNKASTESRGRQSRAAAILTACVILALPIVYLVEYYGHSGQISASSTPATAPAQDLASLEQTVRNSPTIDKRLSLSFAYIQANQPDRAIPILNAIIAENRNNAEAWNNRCVANIMQKSYDAAIEDCRNALRIMPNFQLAQNNMKWAEDESSV